MGRGGSAREKNMRAGIAELFRDGAANAAGGAGDNGRFSFEGF